MAENKKAILGIDIGTSGTKTAVFDVNGKVLADKTVEYPLYQPKNGYAEQDPDDWWNAAVTSIKDCLKKIKDYDVVSIGLSGQMHGLVMLDEDGKVLRNSIIWCDQRTEKERDFLVKKIGNKKLVEITGNPAQTSFTAAKILWVKKNEPGIYKKCKHILLPKDYIRYKLTGEFVSDVSDASGMQAMNIGKRDWSDEILKELKIEKGLLPRLIESTEISGIVSKEAARITGLKEGIIVAGGAGDNPAAAIGTGVYKEGNAFTTIGSSAVVYAVSDKIRIDKKGRVHSLCASVPGKWTVMSCTQGAGLSLKWFRDNFCGEEILEAKKLKTDPYNVMTEEAQTVPIGSDKLLFLPYLMGERSPHPDPDARGVFYGISAIHEKRHFIRAIIEGVSFSQAECVEVFRDMGVPVGNMIVTGGGGKSPFWRKMLASLYSCPITTLKVDEGACFGAAILGGVAAGIYKDIESACKKLIKLNKSIPPDKKEGLAYEPYFKFYKSLYPLLKDSYAKLAKV